MTLSMIRRDHSFSFILTGPDEFGVEVGSLALDGRLTRTFGSDADREVATACLDAMRQALRRIRDERLGKDADDHRAPNLYTPNEIRVQEGLPPVPSKSDMGRDPVEARRTWFQNALVKAGWMTPEELEQWLKAAP